MATQKMASLMASAAQGLPARPLPPGATVVRTIVSAPQVTGNDASAAVQAAATLSGMGLGGGQVTLVTSQQGMQLLQPVTLAPGTVLAQQALPLTSHPQQILQHKVEGWGDAGDVKTQIHQVFILVCMHECVC